MESFAGRNESREIGDKPNKQGPQTRGGSSSRWWETNDEEEKGKSNHSLLCSTGQKMSIVVVEQRGDFN